MVVILKALCVSKQKQIYQTN